MRSLRQKVDSLALLAIFSIFVPMGCGGSADERVDPSRSEPQTQGTSVVAQALQQRQEIAEWERKLLEPKQRLKEKGWSVVRMMTLDYEPYYTTVQALLVQAEVIDGKNVNIIIAEHYSVSAGYISVDHRDPITTITAFVKKNLEDAKEAPKDRPEVLERVARNRGWNISDSALTDSDAYRDFLQELLSLPYVIDTEGVTIFAANHFAVSGGYIYIDVNAPIEDTVAYLRQ